MPDVKNLLLKRAKKLLLSLSLPWVSEKKTVYEGLLFGMTQMELIISYMEDDWGENTTWNHR